MLNRIRRFLESLAYAGLKPSGGVPSESLPTRKSGGLRDRIELFLNGGKPSDPFYLSNRTWKQKMRVPLLIGIPMTLMFVALALIFTNVFSPKAAPPPKPLTPTEMMANLLPDLQNTVHINAYTDAEITALRVVRDEGPPRVVGAVKNKTDHAITVELDLDLADAKGSRVSSATERVSAAAPNASTQFEFPAGNPDTMYAIVRKIRSVK
jgi:hypothetical protein